MIFGEVPVKNAEGTILAHSISVGEQRLRKGMKIGKEQILALMDSGISLISVAKIEADDVEENVAANRLALALNPKNNQTLRSTKANTGRVNLIATGPGLVLLDKNRLIKMNQIDPMITCATVPDFQQAKNGTLVATIKIISYAVAEENLSKACELAKNSLKLVSPKFNKASLLISHSLGGPGKKGIPAIKLRLEALGISLEDVIVVPHEIESLANALRNIGSEMILVLTSSATSDICDTAPSALRVAGGKVLRFGIPVDPGNLLFLGELNDKPVIGFPSCVRSPALNGADWVLSRVACGIELNSISFSQMAIGGLLKEMPSRPHPRQSKK